MTQPAPQPEQGGVHWEQFARRWNFMGPPLSPTEEDVAVARRAVADCAARLGPPRALILGVTPALCRLGWPAGSNVLALDHSLQMIRRVWPGGDGRAACADWLAMPLPDRDRHLVLCDGGATLMEYPHGLQRFAAEVARVLQPGGLFVLRAYVPPPAPETPQRVLADLAEGRMATLDELKLRLALAIHRDAESGVPVHQVWNALIAAHPDLPALARRIGWEPDYLGYISAYRNSPVIYRFMTVPQLSHAFCSPAGRFDLQQVVTGRYTLSECCPTLVMVRR